MSVFSYYPEVWDAAMFEEAVEKVQRLMGKEGTLSLSWSVVDTMREYLPECYEVLINKLDPTGRALDMLAGR